MRLSWLLGLSRAMEVVLGCDDVPDDVVEARDWETARCRPTRGGRILNALRRASRRSAKAVHSARSENVFALSLTCRRKFCTTIEGSWRRAATARTVVAPAAFGSRL